MEILITGGFCSARRLENNNPVDVVDDTYAIKKAKENIDTVLIIAYGGNKYERLTFGRYTFFWEVPKCQE